MPPPHYGDSTHVLQAVGAHKTTQQTADKKRLACLTNNCSTGRALSSVKCTISMGPLACYATARGPMEIALDKATTHLRYTIAAGKQAEARLPKVALQRQRLTLQTTRDTEKAEIAKVAPQGYLQMALQPVSTETLRTEEKEQSSTLTEQPEPARAPPPLASSSPAGASGGGGAPRSNEI